MQIDIQQYWNKLIDIYFEDKKLFNINELLFKLKDGAVIKPINYQQWLDLSINMYKQINFQNGEVNAKLENLILLEQVTKQDKVHILAFSEQLLNEKQLVELSKLLIKRLLHQPIAHLIGKKEFWDLELFVSANTLIPRADTEILVEVALEHAKKLLSYQNKLKILDLGTGTGAIILALASSLNKNYPNTDISFLGVDLLLDVIELAKQNSIHNKINNVNFKQSNWFSNISKLDKFDFIVSNPPYIQANDEHLNLEELMYEPKTALISGQDGYADLFKIIEQSKDYLIKGGYLLLEHGYNQAKLVREYFLTHGWMNITTIKDYSSNERVTFASC